MKRVCLILITGLPVFLLLNLPVRAEIQVEISGNGTSTSNKTGEVNNSSIQVNQNNTSSVSVTVSQSANSGGNNLEEDNGQQSVITGPVSQQTEIDYRINSETAVSPGSQNLTYSAGQAGTKIKVTHLSDVDIQVDATANSGKNRISGNSDDTSIKTGEIISNNKLGNRTDRSRLNFAESANPGINMFQKGNGEGNKNGTDYKRQKEIIPENEITNGINNQTGKIIKVNEISTADNFTQSFIKSGSLNSTADFDKSHLDSNHGNIACCVTGTPTVPGHSGEPIPPVDPAIPPSNNSSANSAVNSSGVESASGGWQLFAALAQILPATAVSAVRFWIIAVVFLLTFLSGLYMRLRAGRSPDRISGVFYIFSKTPDHSGFFNSGCDPVTLVKYTVRPY